MLTMSSKALSAGQARTYPHLDHGDAVTSHSSQGQTAERVLVHVDTLHAGAGPLPSVLTASPEARSRLRDFLSSYIRNPNTRRAYMEAVRQFSVLCVEHGILDLAQGEPVHVAAFVEAQLSFIPQS